MAIGIQPNSNPSIPATNPSLPNGSEIKKFKERDFDAEAKGKTRSILYQAAISSPWTAAQTMNEKEYYDVLDRVVDHCMKRIFNAQS